jgi:hypothetical protein
MSRHGRGCTRKYADICKSIRMKVERIMWQEYLPKPAETSQDMQVTVLWNQQIILGRTTHGNKPDTILRDRKGTCLLIDISMPSFKMY